MNHDDIIKGNVGSPYGYQKEVNSSKNVILCKGLEIENPLRLNWSFDQYSSVEFQNEHAIIAKAVAEIGINEIQVVIGNSPLLHNFRLGWFVVRMNLVLFMVYWRNTWKTCW